MSRVTMRYWAAAKEAAGVAEEQIEARTLAEALAGASARHARLAAVLARCSYLIDEQPAGTRDPDGIVLAEGMTIEVLPPFAGG